MKKSLIVELFFAISLLVACGDDDSSSSGVVDEPEITSSSSSSENEKSSSSVDGGCEVVPYFQEGWPADLDYLSALKGFYAYGSDVGCHFDMEKTEATLYRWKEISPDSSVLEKIGSVPITTTLKSGKSDSSGAERWDNVWKYTTDMSSLDDPALPDGRYRLAWGEGFNVNFYIARSMPEMEWTWGLQSHGLVRVSIDTSFSSNKYIGRAFLFNGEKTERTLLKCNSYWGSLECSVKDIVDTLKDGRYILSMEAVRLSAPDPEFDHAVREARWGNDSLLWALALDSAGNFREGVSGIRLDTNQWIDRTAPKIALIGDAEYSVKANGRYSKRDFSVVIDVFDKLLEREKQTLTVSVSVHHNPVYKKTFEQIADSLRLSLEFSLLDSVLYKQYLDITLEDEFENKDSLKIEELAVADSQQVDISELLP